MFKPRIEQGVECVTVVIDGVPVRVPVTCTAAAAVLLQSDGTTRFTALSDSPRAPYCMMGACYECLMEIDGQPSRQACLIPVAEGMSIRRQRGAPVIED